MRPFAACSSRLAAGRAAEQPSHGGDCREINRADRNNPVSKRAFVYMLVHGSAHIVVQRTDFMYGCIAPSEL
eukprot:13239821-Alexandrium_andersonii.AAC.1